MTTKVLDLNNIERKIFWALLSLLGLVGAFGVYSFSALTFAVIDRDNMNRTAHELLVASGEIEAEYIAQSNSITLAFAQELGFKEVNAKFTGGTSERISMAR